MIWNHAIPIVKKHKALVTGGAMACRIERVAVVRDLFADASAVQEEAEGTLQTLAESVGPAAIAAESNPLILTSTLKSDPPLA